MCLLGVELNIYNILQANGVLFVVDYLTVKKHSKYGLHVLSVALFFYLLANTRLLLYYYMLDPIVSVLFALNVCLKAKSIAAKMVQ